MQCNGMRCSGMRWDVMGWDGMRLCQVGVPRGTEQADVQCWGLHRDGSLRHFQCCMSVYGSASVVKDSVSIWQDFNPKLQASLILKGGDLLAGSRPVPQCFAGACGGASPNTPGDTVGSSCAARAASGASQPSGRSAPAVCSSGGFASKGFIPSFHWVHSPSLPASSPSPRPLPPCLLDPQQSLDTLGEGWEV